MTSLVPPLRAAWLDEPDGLVAPAARDAVLALGFEPVNPVGTGAGGQGPLFVGLGGRHDAWHCRLRRPPGLLSQAGTANTAERSSCAAYSAVRPAFAYVLHDPLAAALHVLHGCAATVLVLTCTSAGPRFAYPVTPPRARPGPGHGSRGRRARSAPGAAARRRSRRRAGRQPLYGTLALPCALSQAGRRRSARAARSVRLLSQFLAPALAPLAASSSAPDARIAPLSRQVC